MLKSGRSVRGASGRHTFQQAEPAWRINPERKSLIKFKVKFCCEQTIKMSKMLQKPVTFMERAVISRCASQSYSVEVGQGIVQEVNGCLLFGLVFNNSWVTAECGMKNTSCNHPSLHLLPLCCCCSRKLGFWAVSWNKQSHLPSQGSTRAGPNKQSSFVLVPIIRRIRDGSSLCSRWLWWRIWLAAPQELSELLPFVECLHMCSSC